jgi:hypothetical protein
MNRQISKDSYLEDLEDLARRLHIFVKNLCKGVCGTGISLARAASGQLIGQKKIVKKKKLEFRHANMS